MILDSKDFIFERVMTNIEGPLVGKEGFICSDTGFSYAKSATVIMRPDTTLKLKFEVNSAAVVFSSNSLQVNTYCASTGVGFRTINSVTGITVARDSEDHFILDITSAVEINIRVIILSTYGAPPEIVY